MALLKDFFSTLKYLPGEMVKTTARTVGKLTPGKELARGLGSILALPSAIKAEAQVLARQKGLTDSLIRAMREASFKNDTEQVERLSKATSYLKSPEIISSVLAEAPTSRQVLASAGELALLSTMGYKPYLPTGKLVSGKRLKMVTSAVKLTKATKAATALKEASMLGKVGIKATSIAKQAVIGGAFFGTMKAQERDATINDIVKSAETGALISGGITAASMAVGGGIQLTKKYVAPRVSSAWAKATTKLEQVATGQAKSKATTQLGKTLSYIGEPLKKKIATGALKTIDVARKTKMRFVDRFAPGARIEKRIAEATGRPLKESEKIYRDMRLLPSVSDAKAENLVNKYIDDLAAYKDVQKQSTAWMAQLDFIDRARLGQKVVGGQSLEQLTKGLERLAREIGPDDMKRVSAVRKITQNYQNNLLKMRVDAGLISQKTVDILRKTHPNYIPHNVIMGLDEKSVMGLSQSLNVAKTDLMKAVGSTKNIQNPISATIQRTQIATRTIEKNKLLNNFVKAQEQYSLFPGMKKVYQTIKTPDGFRKIAATSQYKSPTGFDVISLFRNGTKETWQVPTDIAVAVRNLDAPLTPGWFKFLTFPQKVLKKGATQYNLSFALPNKFRDKQTAALTADAFIKDLTKRYGINPVEMSTIEKMGGWTKAYKTSGGYGSSIWKEGESTILKNLQKTGIGKYAKFANPAKIIDATNDAIEQSTRLGVFQKAIQSGLGLKDAAMVARDATIDFAKMGTWMKPLNQAIPFLNARVQGFANLPKALVASPEAFARMQMYTSVYPTIALHQHNRRFESYENISQYFKNRYWIIMTGEADAIDDYTGQPIKVPQFISIVKGEGQQLISSPIQYYLEKADGTDYRKTSEMIADTIGSASPLEFQQFDQANFLTTAISQLGPVATVATGLGFGKHPYFGTSIVPPSREKAPVEMQFKKTTPETTKKLANLMGVSPAKLEFAISSFGGLPQDLQRSADIVYGVMRDGKIGGHSISETPVGTLTQIPIARRFIRESSSYYSPGMEKEQKVKGQIETTIEGERLIIKDKAEEIFSTMNKKKTSDEKLNYLNSLGDTLTPEIRTKILQLQNSRQTVGVLKKTDSVELRARYILQKIDEMKSGGVTREDIVGYLDDLENAGILTAKTKERIAELKNQ